VTQFTKNHKQPPSFLCISPTVTQCSHSKLFVYETNKVRKILVHNLTKIKHH